MATARRLPGAGVVVEEDRGFSSPCHVWRGAISPEGYGRLGIRYAHVMAYEAQHGPIPEGLEIDHLCRQRDCWNAEHLEAVTRKINARRGAKAKLDEAKVAAIRAEAGAGTLHRVLAARFGVSRPTVTNVIAGRVWAD